MVFDRFCQSVQMTMSFLIVHSSIRLVSSILFLFSKRQITTKQQNKKAVTKNSYIFLKGVTFN